MCLVLLTGCGTSTAGIADVTLVCPSWREITVSKADKLTEKTARRIEGNNEARLAQGCPPDPERARDAVPPPRPPAKPQKERLLS